MLVGIMPISAIAADAEPPAAQTGVSTKTSENTTGPKLEKSAQWVDEKAGIAKITIQVTGEQPTETTKKTDIVLVIDRSLSMTQYGRDWLDNAKKAAKVFAKKVLTGDPNVRIAVVAYAAKTINDWGFSSDLETVKAQEYKKLLNIKCKDVAQPISALSGGNQQKVILGKWILCDSDILILDEPTRGIDVGAKYEIYQIINQLAASGKTVIFISSDMPEILGMCDRVYVMNEGEIVGELKGTDITQENIMRAIMHKEAI